MKGEAPLDEKTIGKFTNFEKNNKQEINDHEDKEIKNKEIREGLEGLKDDLDRLSFMFGESKVTKWESEDSEGKDIVFFIAQPESSNRDNKYIITQTRESLIFISTPFTMLGLHQDIFEATEKHINNLKCIGGGMLRLNPVKMYGTSGMYNDVSLEIKKRLEKEIKNKMKTA